MYSNVKWFKVQKKGWETSRIIPVSSENIRWYIWNESSEKWEENDDGNIQGLMVWNGRKWELYINHKIECDILYEVQFKILDSTIEYYGVGISRVVAVCDGEIGVYSESCWTGELGYRLIEEE